MAWYNKEHKVTKLCKDEHGESVWLPFEPPTEKILCHLCAEPISLDEGVYWHGPIATGALGKEIKPFSGYIFLHAECAKTIAIHLAKDALLSINKEYIYKSPKRRNA